MKHFQQPKDSRLCGQTCVAMVLGVHLANVVAVIGRGGTHYKTLQTAMNKLGSKKSLGAIVQRRSSDVDYPTKGTYIARITWSRKPYSSHFVVLKDGKVYDPWWATGGIPFKAWLESERTYHWDNDLNLTSWAKVIK